MTNPTSESAKPVGWIDEFGNVFPLAAYRPPGNLVHDGYKTKWKHVYTVPIAQTADASLQQLMERAAEYCDGIGQFHGPTLALRLRAAIAAIQREGEK